jgi:hypothetical protein
MVINFCTVHAQAFNTTDAGCETDLDKVWDYIKNVRVQTQFVTKYFNPELYVKNDSKLDWMGTFAREKPFFKGTSI